MNRLSCTRFGNMASISGFTEPKIEYTGGMESCIFCEIATSDSEQILWQNEVAAAFKSISPEAKIHVLVVPKHHVKNIDALDDEVLAGQMIMAVREVIKLLGIVEANKVMVQGIEINHLHFHVMSDRRYKG
jgi:histidine triad (HIT) family protein